MAIVGSSIVVGKVAVARLPVFLLSGLRFAVAAAILGVLVLLVERPLPRLARRDVAVLALQSFAGIFAFNVLLLEGLRFTSAAEGGIVTSTTPAVAAALAVVALGERWSRPRTLGVALAVAGILALNTAGGLGARGPWPLMFLPAALLEMRAFPLSRLALADWALVGYYGVVVTVVAFLLWARGVARVPASAASVFTGVLPVSALALSHLALGETITPPHVGAAALVILGIVVLARAG